MMADQNVLMSKSKNNHGGIVEANQTKWIGCGVSKVRTSRKCLRAGRPAECL